MIELHRILNRWVQGITGGTVIAAYQGQDRPALPYVMTNITGAQPLAAAPRATRRYDDAGDARAEAVLDVEYRASLHAYGPDPMAILAPFAGVRHITEAMEPLLPYRLQEVGQTQFVPEKVGERWEPRAVLRLTIHGTSIEDRPGFIAESVEDITISNGA